MGEIENHHWNSTVVTAAGKIHQQILKLVAFLSSCLFRNWHYVSWFEIMSNYTIAIGFVTNNSHIIIDFVLKKSVFFFYI